MPLKDPAARRAWNAAWYAAHREQRRARQAAYDAAHSEEIRAKKRVYRESHRGDHADLIERLRKAEAALSVDRIAEALHRLSVPTHWAGDGVDAVICHSAGAHIPYARALLAVLKGDSE